MPLTIPNLDDRTFDQLLAEAESLIAKYYPAWTDYNYSDPGITFLELFAFLFENAIYQIDQVPQRSVEYFESLAGAPLSQIDRIVTDDDFKSQIVANSWANGQITIARVHVTFGPVKPITSDDSAGTFSDEPWLQIFVVPNVPNVPNDPGSSAPTPTPEVRQQIFDFVRSRALITTRLRVLPPDYCDVSLHAIVVRNPQSRVDQATIREAVSTAVRRFLDPTRGWDGQGWPFGRSIYRSDLCPVIEAVNGVDHLRKLYLGGDDTVSELSLSGPNCLIAWEEETLEVDVVDQ